MTYTPDFTQHVTEKLTPQYAQGNYYNSSSPGSVEATITGPAYIQTGMICRNNHGYAYSQHKYNDEEFIDVPLGARAGGLHEGSARSIYYTTIGPFFLESGETYTVKVGHTFSGSSNSEFGGAYWIKYYQL